MFVLIVVETVEDDEDHAGETEEGGGGHQEQDQLPQQGETEETYCSLIRLSLTLTCPSFSFSWHLKS